MNKNGYQEVEHTADVEVEVWGQDKPSLFIQAAKGMYHLSQVIRPEEVNEYYSRSFTVKGNDLESLLVSYLSELLFHLETEQLAFEEFDLQFLDEYRLRAQAKGYEILGQHREIKAVTYHYLDIQKRNSGWKVNVVFDV